MEQLGVPSNIQIGKSVNAILTVDYSESKVLPLIFRILTLSETFSWIDGWEYIELGGEEADLHS